MLFFLMLMLALPNLAVAPKIDMRFQRFGTDEGLSETRINDIFQDRLGFLWIATNNGLNRYDGYSFLSYRHIPGDPNSLSGNNVDCIHDDHLGRLWIGTWSGVDCLDPLSDRILHPDLGDTATGHCLEETRKGEMWIGKTNARIIRMEIASGRQLPLPESLSDWLAGLKGQKRRIWGIHEDATGMLWITPFGGIYRFSPTSGSLTQFSDTDDCICLDKDGSIWIMSCDNARLVRFDPRRGILHRFSPPKEKAGFYVNTLLADRQQQIWIGSDSGIRLFDAKRGQYLTLKSLADDPGGPLRGRINSSFCEDAAGNVWIGVFGGGLFKFNPRSNRFEHIVAHADPHRGLNDAWVSAILQDREGMIWIGTRNGGLSRYDPENHSFSHYGGTRGFTSQNAPSSIEALCEDSLGNLWIGGGDDLFLFDRRRDRLQRLPLTNSSHSNIPMPRRIMSILEESPGRLWIGTMGVRAQGVGLFSVDPRRHQVTALPFYKQEPENPPLITVMLRDHSGRLWISTYGGLFCYLPTEGRSMSFRFDPHKPGSISSDHLTGMLEDRNGNLWIGSDQGLNLMDRRSGTFQIFDEDDGLSGNFVYDMAEDADGMIWVGTNRGLSRLDPKSGTFRNYGASDGMAVGGVYCINHGRNGKLLCGGYQGAAIFNPREVAEINDHVPPVVVTGIRKGNSPVPLHTVFSARRQAEKAGRVELKPADRVLSVEFAALDFTAPEKNRYAFRMEGEADEWTNLGAQRQVTFSGLAVGEHMMRIKGSNNDGVWNEKGVMLRIVVLPRFWQTWWFKLLVLLGLSLLAWGLVHLRRRFVALRRMAEPPNLDDICAEHDVSQREQEVLRLVIQGKSNRDIENALFISVPTVKRHLANIFEKFAVHSRLQLINLLRVKSAAPAEPRDKA